MVTPKCHQIVLKPFEEDEHLSLHVLGFPEKKLGGEEQNEKGTFLKYRCVLGVVIFFLNVTSKGVFSSLEGEVLQVARFPRHIFFGS